jgi:hypothetical protein
LPQGTTAAVPPDMPQAAKTPVDAKVPVDAELEALKKQIENL